MQKRDAGARTEFAHTGGKRVGDGAALPIRVHVHADAQLPQSRGKVSARKKATIWFFNCFTSAPCAKATPSKNIF